MVVSPSNITIKNQNTTAMNQNITAMKRAITIMNLRSLLPTSPTTTLAMSRVVQYGGGIPKMLSPPLGSKILGVLRAYFLIIFP